MNYNRIPYMADCPSMGVIQDDFSPPPRDETPLEDDTPWYAQPVDWFLDIVGNVNYIDENVRISTTDGVLTVDRSGGYPTPAPAPAAPGVMALRFPNVPTWAWVAGAGVLALMVIRR